MFLFLFQITTSAQQPDTIVIQRNDTIIELIRPGAPPREVNGKKIEEILENHSERSFFTQKLHEWLVKSSRDKANSTPGANLDNLEKFEGKQIKNIDIRHIPPFGGSVDDTVAVGNSWLARIGNRF